MAVELCCTCCASRFVAEPNARCEDVLDQMFRDGPRFALGDGETFEDMIFTTIMEHGNVSCPKCGESASVSEESLGVMAMSLIYEM